MPRGSSSQSSRRFRPARLLIVLVLAVVLLLVRQALFPAGRPAAGASGKSTAPPSAAKIQVSVQSPLSQAVSGDAATVLGQTIWVAGGLTAQGLSSNSLVPYQIGTGPGNSVALPERVHDAAAASLGGQIFLFGGGRFTSSARAMAFTPPGQFTTLLNLPTPLSDLWAGVLGGQLVLGGGHNTGAPNSTIWSYHRVTNSYQVIGALPVATRYAATAVLSQHLYVIGGETARGASPDIISVGASGSTKVVAELPVSVWKAAAGVLQGQIYIFGGKVSGALTSTIYRFDPATGQVTAVGHLPAPWAYGAAVSTVSGIYLLGGEGSGGTLATVYRVTLVR